MVWLETVTFWHWLALGAALTILEIVLPGMFLLWLGAAGFLTGGLLWLLPKLTIETQLIFFAVLSVLSVLVGRVVQRGSREEESDQPLLNQRGEQYVGGIYVLEDDMANGHGKVSIGDTVWSVEMTADEPGLPAAMPKGAFVKVIGVEGATLIVEPGSDWAYAER